MKFSTPLIKVNGCTGQPGIYKSIGYFSKNSLFNFELSKIFDNLEVEYKIKICKEIRTQIQNYYDKHRKMVEKTLKFAK